MMDFFELILDGFATFANMIVVCLVFTFGIVTLPLWIIPYLIYKKVNNNER